MNKPLSSRKRNFFAECSSHLFGIVARDVPVNKIRAGPIHPNGLVSGPGPYVGVRLHHSAFHFQSPLFTQFLCPTLIVSFHSQKQP